MNFDQTLDRRGTDSMKWEVAEGQLPMGLADMDFETVPEVKEAILRRAQHGAYGYTLVSEAWKPAYQNWWLRTGCCFAPAWFRRFPAWSAS